MNIPTVIDGLLDPHTLLTKRHLSIHIKGLTTACEYAIYK